MSNFSPDTCHSPGKMLLEEKRGNDQRAVERAAEMCKLLVTAPNRHVKCCSFAPIVDFDFRPIHESCQLIFEHAQNPQGSILHNATRESAEMAAQMCRDTIIPNMEKGMELGFQDSVEILASASPIAAQMAQSVSIGLGFVHGLKGAQAWWWKSGRAVSEASLESPQCIYIYIYNHRTAYTQRCIAAKPQL